MNGKDLEGSDRSLIEILSRNSPRGTEENNENPQSGQQVSTSRFESKTSRIESRGVTVRGNLAAAIK